MPHPKFRCTHSAPSVRKGDIVTCLYRDTDCVVTGLHDGRIPWPRVRAREHRGGSGLLVNETLVQAIRTESATALVFWFGVSSNVVWRWRRAFLTGEGKFRTPGSKAAHQQASQAGAEAIKAKEWTAKERAARRKTARRLGLQPKGRWTIGGWKKAELELVGTDHDEAIAKKIGRTRTAVTVKRVSRGITAYSEWPGGGRAWTAEEEAILGTDADWYIAKRLDRTASAVAQRRSALGIVAFAKRRWTSEEDALLGTDDDEVIAAKIGRTPMSVTLRRCARGIPVHRDRRAAL
jgi:hypothetical protein